MTSDKVDKLQLLQGQLNYATYIKCKLSDDLTRWNSTIEALEISIANLADNNEVSYDERV